MSSEPGGPIDVAQALDHLQAELVEGVRSVRKSLENLDEATVSDLKQRARDGSDALAIFLRLREKLPRGWEPASKVYTAWRNRELGLQVIESCFRFGDDKIWHHVSFSRRSRLPDWNDTALIKELFIGPELESYIVLAPAAKYVNHHPYTLHLWTCLEGPVLPDFRVMGTI